MNQKQSSKILLILAATCALSNCGLRAADDWKDETISPVANPLFFEAPQIQSEVRPLFVQHNIDNNFITGGGEVRVYAVQLRYALTERLALIATKDGYIEFKPNTALPHKNGWADLAAGLKYAV